MTEAFASAVLGAIGDRGPASFVVGTVAGASLPVAVDPAALVPPTAGRYMLEVDVDGDSFECDWTTSFESEVRALGASPVGRDVLLVRVAGQFCCIGIYVTGAK
jgi:hypothetical protein